MTRLLITGSAGLVGRHLRATLMAAGHSVVQLDLASDGPAHGDVRDRSRVVAAMTGVSGIIHLAAISRVVWAEADPGRCWSTNVEGLACVLACAAEADARPWIVFASSREVYGQRDSFPVTEDAPLSPLNVYGRAKVAGEELVAAASARGLRGAIVRLSNVYGCTADHADRVVPAFARAAAEGTLMRVEGADHAFDFTHVSDVVRGIAAVCARLSAGGVVDEPVQLVTGTPTTLGELARAAAALGGDRCRVELAAPRTFDVERFYGDNARAKRLLAWRPEISLDRGLAQLVEAFRTERGVVEQGKGGRTR